MASHGITTDQTQPDFRGALLSIFFTAVLLVVSGVFAYSLYTNTRSQELNRKEAGPVPRELHKLRTYELEQLHQYRWVDQQKGLVQLPIDVAMRKVVDRYN